MHWHRNPCTVIPIECTVIASWRETAFLGTKFTWDSAVSGGGRRPAFHKAKRVQNASPKHHVSCENRELSAAPRAVQQQHSWSQVVSPDPTMPKDVLPGQCSGVNYSYSDPRLFCSGDLLSNEHFGDDDTSRSGRSHCGLFAAGSACDGR
jgi:hypothetical protein